MKKLMIAAATLSLSAPVFAGLYGDTPDAKHAWSVHDMNRPNPVKVAPATQPGQAPSDAVVLFDGTAESFARNWCDEKGKPSQWKLGDEGDFYCIPGWKNGGAIYTRGEYGDCQLHIEYRHDADLGLVPKDGAQMHGNSGVFLMGNYEIQVLESYGTNPADMKNPNYADGQAGAVYAENPPMVNPARKPGEWQVYDIVFHPPVWDGLRLVHPGTVTVFFNGVLVQDAWQMDGVKTFLKRTTLQPHGPVGPLRLQDHGCIVQFRNVWYRPLVSRWADATHGLMAADENAVMKQRRETAARLFAKVADPSAATAENVKALGEVIAYANEGKYKAAFEAALNGYKAKPGDAKEVEGVNKALDILIRNKVVDASCRIDEAK